MIDMTKASASPSGMEGCILSAVREVVKVVSCSMAFSITPFDMTDGELSANLAVPIEVILPFGDHLEILPCC